jgi:hypothetical protein
LSPLLQRAIDVVDGLASLEQVLDAIQNGRAQYWTHENSVLVTQIMDYARAKCLRFSMAGGVMKEVLELRDRAMADAKAQGCTRAEIFGRIGWMRQLGPDWRLTGVILRREI